MTPDSTLHLALLDPWHDQEYIPAAWTMRYEMAFYIMFGLCLLPYIGRPLLVFWISVAIWHCLWVTSRLVHPPFAMPFYWFVNGHATRFVAVMEFYFFAGLAAGFAYAKLRLGRKLLAGIFSSGELLFFILLPQEQWGTQYGPSPAFSGGMACVRAVTVFGLAGLERQGAFKLGRLARRHVLPHLHLSRTGAAGHR
jgi:exopolysaccharide production protein ExoZ